MTNMNEYLPERLATNPLQAMESDSDIEAIADAVISASVLRDECDGDAAFKKSARQLLYACLGYLRDWCSLEQRTVGNLKALLDAARPSSSGSTVTDLGDLFYLTTNMVNIWSLHAACIPSPNGVSSVSRFIAEPDNLAFSALVAGNI